MRLVRITNADGTDIQMAFDCPGCGSMHSVRVAGKEPVWGFNQDMFYPTFSPSLLVRKYRGQEVSAVCHSFIKDGKIQFLQDCTHRMAGITVDLQEVDEDE